MIHRSDLVSAVIALSAHACLGYVLLRAAPARPRERSLVEVDIRAPKAASPPSSPQEPHPAPAPAPPPIPRARRLTAARTNASAQPTPSAPPAPPRAVRENPSPPVFGVTMESTTAGDASMSVPVGNTTALDPRDSAPRRGPVRPLAPSAGAGVDPGGDLAIRSMPDIDADACGRTVAYPKEAAALAIEGTVKLRVALDEQGRVVDVKVLSGLGHGLDQAAVDAIEHHCRFTPAIAHDGQPIAFVIAPYFFHFEIPR